ncbi:AMP-binding protein, partial [Klebsiella pneumoniae]
TADAGWVTGHSYGIYGPLLAGLTTVLCEVNSPGEYWWQMVETLGITRMLTIAGAIRMARRQGKPRADLTSLRTLYLAGEPLDNATDEWVAAQLGVPCENHYWQTESGWPLLAGSGRALSPVFTRAAEVVHPASGKTCAPGETGMLVINNTLGPG